MKSKCNSQIVFTLVVVAALSSVTFASFYPWMYHLPYGETVTLKPLYRNKSESIAIRSCKWTTPSHVDLVPNNYNYDLSRYRLDVEKCELTIYDIQKETNGVYHCTINDVHISKAMLNVFGEPKYTFMAKYRLNLIAGFTTAGGIHSIYFIDTFIKNEMNFSLKRRTIFSHL